MLNALSRSSMTARFARHVAEQPCDLVDHVLRQFAARCGRWRRPAEYRSGGAGRRCAASAWSLPRLPPAGVWNQCQVDVEAVALAGVESELADGLQKGQALNVADGAADLGDNDIHARRGDLADGGLDLVGDMRNDLHGAAEIVAAPRSFLDDGAVNPAGRVVAVAVERDTGEAFVVAQIEIGFGFARRPGRKPHRAGKDSSCPDRR